MSATFLGDSGPRKVSAATEKYTNAEARFLPPLSTHDSRQIRLLSIRPATDDVPITCDVDVVTLTDRPEYLAISYSWGSPDEVENICINGTSVVVRRNCHYALWQLRHRGFSFSLWIDSICIDQANLREKSQQVGMMSEIYIQATCAAICIGPHADDSDLLAGIVALADVQLLHSWYQIANKHLAKWPYTWNSIADDDLETHDLGVRVRDHLIDNINVELEKSNRDVDFLDWQQKDYLRLITRTIAAFSQRPFWERLWIIQEVKLAPETIIVCGEDFMDWETLRRVFWSLSTFSPPIIELETDLTDISFRAFLQLRPGDNSTLPHSQKLDEVLFFQFGNPKCSNPLDHIYGLLSLVTVPQDVRTPLMPDYKKSAFDLAIDVLPYLAMRDNHFYIGTYGYFLRKLQVAGCPEVRAALVEKNMRSRCHHAKVRNMLHLCSERAAVITPYSRLAQVTNDARSFLPQREAFGPHLGYREVVLDETGRLTTKSCVNETQPSEANASTSTSLAVLPYEKLTLGQKLNETCCLFPELWINDKPVAKLPCRAEAGDLLVHTGEQEYAVVRRRTVNMYEYIGSLTLYSGFPLCGEWEKCTCSNSHHTWHGMSFIFFIDHLDLIRLHLDSEAERISESGDSSATVTCEGMIREAFSSFAVMNSMLARGKDLPLQEKNFYTHAPSYEVEAQAHTAIPLNTVTKSRRQRALST